MDIAIDRMPFQTAKDMSFEGKHGAVVKLGNTRVNISTTSNNKYNANNFVYFNLIRKLIDSNDHKM